MNPLPLLSLLAFGAPDTPPGDKLPPGPPWHTEYRTAQRDAVRHGRPVFVYFTKTV
ncbi:MAG: hypothetical protein KDC87_18800 [Planctomycetes bacterium]|nr:hypothetical protein [Planctomycetota bacterium]MCB9869132.1 hypothetical protein [Planctomycetota bacterium]MCB9889032.1 hypothetical protein [Planctomycetota bacterium]